MKRTGEELLGFKKGKERYETIAIKNKLGLYRADISPIKQDAKGRCRNEPSYNSKNSTRKKNQQ